jgi:hypothetical protein
MPQNGTESCMRLEYEGTFQAEKQMVLCGKEAIKPESE